MTHVEPDVIALLALGEDAEGPGDGAHLRGCAACRREYTELRAVVTRMRAVPPAERSLEAPPERVWESIAAATGVESPADTRGRLRAVGAGATEEAADGRRRRGRRTPPQPWLLAAAAVLLVVVVSAVAVLGRTAAGPAGEVLAETSLEPLDAPSPGEATLVAVDDGLRLEVAPGDLPEFDGYYELWLIDENVERLISLGPLVEEGAHDLPGGIDPVAYPVVDVSRETFDGDPTHSGDSVLRGTLPVE